jgi:lysozyme
MRLSENGLSFIKRWEGFIPTPYDDGYGNLTVGYGHKIRPGESFTQISEAEGSQLLAQDVAWAEDAVNRNVRVPLTQAQFDALVSLVFNWGAGNFAESLLLQRLNAGDYAGAAERLGEHPVTSGGQYSAGLARRRQEEKAIFLSGGSPDSSASQSGAGPLFTWLAIGGAIAVAWALFDD